MIQTSAAVLLLAWLLAWPAALLAEQGGPTPLFGKRAALLQPASAPRTGPAGPSLFAGAAAGSLLAPMPARPRAERSRTGASGAPVRQAVWTDPRIALGGGGAPDVMLIRQLIGLAESHRDGYDAVVWSARIKPFAPPTRMTLGQIFEWIRATPGQNHAIGRYQFIPSTLRRLVREAGLSADQRFTPAVQDRLADILLAEAGLAEARAGRIGRHQLMNNLARIWAGLPTASGRSHYHGVAGNRATVSWARMDAELARHFPRRG